MKTQELFRPPNKNYGSIDFTLTLLSTEKSKCERINKQATLTHIHNNTVVKWKVKE